VDVHKVVVEAAMKIRETIVRNIPIFLDKSWEIIDENEALC